LLEGSTFQSLIDMKLANATKSALGSLGLRNHRPKRAVNSRGCLGAAVGATIVSTSLFMPTSTQTAIANGDTRTLNLRHSHTGETIQATFRVNGAYDQAVLQKLNWFLRDWRNNDTTRMDPRLFDVVWEVYRSAGATQPVVIFSAYRSPATNAMLRSRSSGVAENSLHMRGMAMDTTMPGMSMQKIREIGMRLQRGGVGYYSSSNFVHLDVGNVRAWPRMTYDQLARLFPDGKTVHLASNGRALPRFEEARAELASRGGGPGPVIAQNPGAGLFAWLFGNGNDAQPAESASDLPRRGAVATASLKHGRTRPERALANAAPAPARPAPEPASAMVASLSPMAPNRGEPLAVPDKREKQRRLVVPVPPLRPQEEIEVARVYASVPEPPGRPEDLVKVAELNPAAMTQGQAKDAIGGLIGKGKTGEPINRAAGLPVVITQGSKDRPGLPAQVLAYAPSSEADDDASAPAPDKPAVAPPRRIEASLRTVAPARIDRSNYRGATSQKAITASATQSLLGPAFAGLRQAALISPDILSPVPSIGYVAVFAARATDLNCAHFAGAATKPLGAAPGLVRIMESSLRVREN
jgi:uncharacterized protein YcbK (DUF882 family)